MADLQHIEPCTGDGELPLNRSAEIVRCLACCVLPLILLLTMPTKADAQASDQFNSVGGMDSALQNEGRRHAIALEQINEQETLAAADERKKQIDCSGDTDDTARNKCMQSAADAFQATLRDLEKQIADENALDQNNISRIRLGLAVDGPFPNQTPGATVSVPAQPMPLDVTPTGDGPVPVPLSPTPTNVALPPQPTRSVPPPPPALAVSPVMSSPAPVTPTPAPAPPAREQQPRPVLTANQELKIDPTNGNQFIFEKATPLGTETAKLDESSIRFGHSGILTGAGGTYVTPSGNNTLLYGTLVP
jgi:hypothetical protein